MNLNKNIDSINQKINTLIEEATTSASTTHASASSAPAAPSMTKGVSKSSAGSATLVSSDGAHSKGSLVREPLINSSGQSDLKGGGNPSDTVESINDIQKTQKVSDRNQRPDGFTARYGAILN